MFFICTIPFQLFSKSTERWKKSHEFLILQRSVVLPVVSCRLHAQESLIFFVNAYKIMAASNSATADTATDESDDDFDPWPAPCTTPFGCSVITNFVGEWELMEHASHNIFGSVGVAEVATHRSRTGNVYYHPGRSSNFGSFCPVGFTHFGEPGFIHRNGTLNSPTQPLAAFAQSQLDTMSVLKSFPGSAEL